MDCIPNEVLSAILDNVTPRRRPDPDHSLSKCAIVSRKWQAAVERITFRDLQLSASSDYSDTTDLHRFKQAFQGGNVVRRAYLRTVLLKSKLSTKKRGPACCLVSWRNESDDSIIWSGIVMRLFNILNDITQRYGSQYSTMTLPSISLAFRSMEYHGGYGTLQLVGAQCRARRHDITETRLAKKRPGSIELYGSRLLPILMDVSSLTASCRRESIYLRPTWIGKLVAKLPCLRDLTINLYDEYKWGRDWRWLYQQDLMDDINTMLPKTLQTIQFHVDTLELFNEDAPVHILHQSGSGHGYYSCLFSTLSRFEWLRELHLPGSLCVSAALFDLCEAPATVFPLLESFLLEFGPETSDGKWFFLRDERAFANAPHYELDYDDSDDDTTVYGNTVLEISTARSGRRYRSLPNPETFTPFLLSAAKACANMPRIKQFCMKLGRESRNRFNCGHLDFKFVDRVFELWYMRAGREMNTLKCRAPFPFDASHLHRAYFSVGNYFPDDKVVHAWRLIVGRSGKLFFLDKNYCSEYALRNASSSDIKDPKYILIEVPGLR